jgi:uncharacterized membrane protein YfcA
LHISLPEYLVVALTAGVGATVQGSVGFGANLITVPVVAVVVPEALPVVLWVWVLPLVAAMAVREHRGVDWSGLGWITSPSSSCSANGHHQSAARLCSTSVTVRLTGRGLGLAAARISPGSGLRPRVPRSRA